MMPDDIDFSFLFFSLQTRAMCAAGGQDVLVGIVHNCFWTEPKGSGILYAHVRSVLHSYKFVC